MTGTCNGDIRGAICLQLVYLQVSKAHTQWRLCSSNGKREIMIIIEDRQHQKYSKHRHHLHSVLFKEITGSVVL